MGLTCVIKRSSAQRPFSVLQLTGSVDSSTAEKLNSFLAMFSEQGQPRVVVDLTNVDYVSSAGWRSFLAAVRSASEKHMGFVLVGMGPQVKDIFDLLGLERVIEVYDSMGALLRATSTADETR